MNLHLRSGSARHADRAPIACVGISQSPAGVRYLGGLQWSAREGIAEGAKEPRDHTGAQWTTGGTRRCCAVPAQKERFMVLMGVTATFSDLALQIIAGAIAAGLAGRAM